MSTTIVRDPRNSRVPVPTARFVLLMALASLIVLVLPLKPGVSLLVVNGVLVLLSCLDSWFAPKPSTIVVTREVPPVLALDASGEITWIIGNPKDRRVLVDVADSVPLSFHAGRRGARLWLPRNGQATSTVSFAPSRRGHFELSEVTVRVTGRLGLGARQGRQYVSDVVKVYPPFRSRKEAEMRIEKARILEIGLRSVRGHGGGTEFEQLREYGPDDDFRRMDWAATARLAKPIVRTYRAEQNQNITMLLDTGRVMAGRVADVPRLEHAMDAVMTLATVASRLGDRVGMTAFDNAVEAEVAAGHGNTQVARITEAMYRLEPQLVESDYRGAFVHALSRNRRRSLVVILTELSAHGISDTLKPALPLMLRKHVVIVASVKDPDVAEWAESLPTEANKAYRKAAAISAVEERRRTIASLRAMGVTVVDAVPGKLSTGLADAYLNVKATGRL